MGKSNRIRTQRAENTAKNPLSKKTKKKGAPSWLYPLIAAVVTLAVLASVAVGIISANGVVMRWSKAVKSDNYTINGNMMSYLFYVEYEEFQNTYSSYMTQFSLDTTKSLKDQTFGDTSTGTGYEIYYLGQFEGTWFDYFASLAEASAKQILIYCEEARARGIELEDAEKAQIDSAIASLQSVASTYGYSGDAYAAMTYGQGVKIKDIRNMMELSSLAAKCAAVAEDEIIDAITDEQIEAKYSANKLDFDIVDYIYYTIGVKYDDVVKDMASDATDDDKLAEYTRQINEAKDAIEQLNSNTSADALKKAIYTYVAEKEFDEQYESENLADEDKVDETALAAIKSAMVAKVVEEIVADAASSDDTDENEGTYTIYEQTVTKKAAESMDDIKEALYEAVSDAKETYVVSDKAYVADDDVSSWLFDDARAVGNHKTVLEGDGAESDEVTKKDGSFSASVYFLTATKHRDRTLSRNVYYLSFTAKEDAEAAIEAFKNGDKTADAFGNLGDEYYASTNGVLDNYLKGSMNDQKFENWLYADTTVVGSYTTEAIEMKDTQSQSTLYGVFFYESDGEETWYINAKADIYSENYEAYYAGLQAKFIPVVNAKVISKIDA